MYEKGKRDLEATNSTCFMAPLEEPHLHLIQEGIAGRTTASGWKTVVPGSHDRTRWHYCCPQISRCLLKALFDEELLAMIQLLEIPREQSRALPKKPPRRLLWVQGIARTYPPSGCSKFRGWKGKQLSQRDPPSSEYSTLVIMPDGSGRKLRTAHRNPRSGPPCACVRACMAGLCSVKPSEK
jgi:hypothetical protein